MSNFGVVEYFGQNESSHPCGYCKGIKPENCDSGMWSHTLTTTNYQHLIDRGWRRSGKYCYKPIADKSCCPAYTIRCDAINFKLSKSQKKVIKKFNRFLISGQKPSKRAENEIHNTIETIERVDDCNVISDITDLLPEDNTMDTNQEKDRNKNVSSIKPNKGNDKSDMNIAINHKKKARALRIERKLKKIITRERCSELEAKLIMNREFKKKKTKTIEDYINEYANTETKHKLDIKYVSTTSDDYKETFELSYEVYKKYQMSIHKDSDDNCTRNQFKRFLIDSPLEAEESGTENNLPNHFGSYHQQYWLNDTLIAVGVLDVLPNCVSSVYLYYDPEYDFLSLGTYSALREIYLVRRLQRFIPNLSYYYMGFYIHSCPKMKYKGKFVPSDLLCPETYTWHVIQKCTVKLDINKYSRLEDDMRAIDSSAHNISDKKIMILHNRLAISFYEYKRLRKNISQSEEQTIKDYAKLVGHECVNKLLLYRSF